MLKNKSNASKADTSGTTDTSEDTGLRKIPLWKKICAVLLVTGCILCVCMIARYADGDMDKFDQILRLAMSRSVSNEQLIDAGIETWPSIKDTVGCVAVVTLVANGALNSVIILSVVDDCLKSLKAENAKLKADLKEQDAKLDKILGSIALAQYLKDDENVKTLQEVFETIATMSMMVEQLVESNERYDDIDAANSPASSDD